MTTTLPSWVEETCPTWCAEDHALDRQWSPDSELHVRRFGALVAVAVEIRSDGEPVRWDTTVEGFDANDPADLTAASAVLGQAAAWIVDTILPAMGRPALA